MERRRIPQEMRASGFNNNPCNAVYTVGDGLLVTRKLTQVELSELLRNPEVCLISVNDKGGVYKPHAKRKKGV